MSFGDRLAMKFVQWSGMVLFGWVVTAAFMPDPIRDFVGYWVEGFGHYVKAHFEKGNAT